MFKRTLISTLVAGAMALSAGASAQVSDGVIKIGVINDMSGLYADITGQGSVIAARMAVEDFGAAKKNMKVEILSADHQNKPDIGSSIVRKWFDTDKVDAWGNGFWTITNEELHRYSKFVEMATLLNVEKRIEELTRHSDPVTQAGATAVLRILRGEK